MPTADNRHLHLCPRRAKHRPTLPTEPHPKNIFFRGDLQKTANLSTYQPTIRAESRPVREVVVKIYARSKKSRHLGIPGITRYFSVTYKMPTPRKAEK